MFFNSLRRLRPQTSIFLAAAAIAVGAACGGEAGPPDNMPTPTGGTTGGGAATGAAGGMSDAGAGTMGGTASLGGTTTMGGTTDAGTTSMGGTTTMGGTTDAGTTSMGGTTTMGGTTDSGTASMGGTTDAGGGAWMPVVPSKVAHTADSPTKCSSTGLPTGDKCGSYYCNVTKATLTPEINPSKPCGQDSDGKTTQDVYDYVCTASLPDVVTKCAGMFTADAILDAAGFKTKTTNCVKADPSVVSKKVPDTCLACFAQVALCCAADTFGCAIDCADGASAACDAAQKKANCVSPLWACAGLPDPT